MFFEGIEIVAVSKSWSEKSEAKYVQLTMERFSSDIFDS